jgi:hypothetical protein
MKLLTLVLLPAALCLSGCLSVEFPNIVSDSTKAAKSLLDKKEKEAVDTREMFAQAQAKGEKKLEVNHTYIGKDNQTVAEIKQGCVVEATQKFAQITGTDVKSVVLENEVVSMKGKVVANCKLALQQ